MINALPAKSFFRPSWFAIAWYLIVAAAIAVIWLQPEGWSAAGRHNLQWFIWNFVIAGLGFFGPAVSVIGEAVLLVVGWRQRDRWSIVRMAWCGVLAVHPVYLLLRYAE